MKKVYLILGSLLAIVVCIGLVACGSDDEETSLVSLTLSGLEKQFPRNKGNAQNAQQLEITCNSTWIIVSKPEWIDVNATGGEGSKTVLVWTNSENTTGVERSGVIIVSSGDIIKSKEVSQTAQFGTVEVEKTIDLNTSNTLVVKLNGSDLSGAVVTYQGQAGVQNGAVYTWENAAKTGKIKVGGSLLPQTVFVNFGERNTVVVEIDAVKASTNQVAQSTVYAGGDVENDAANQNNTGASVKLNLNGAIADTKGSSRTFMVTVYTPATGEPKEVIKNQTYTQTPYAVACEPSGTEFTYPGIHMDLTVEGAGEIGTAGIKFEHADGTPANNKKVYGNIVSCDLPHFSIWNFVVVIECVDIVDGEEQIAAGSLQDGDNTITYNEYYGYRSDATGILKKSLHSLFGAEVSKVAKSVTIKSESEGSYIITQKVRTMTFKSGNKTYKAKCYDKVSCKIKVLETYFTEAI